jgi:asparagine synthase (glutamine-hydrolysing)
MCGIAGIFNLKHRDPVASRDISQMLAMLRHRGPDQFGIYTDGPVGLGNARLSIIDLSTGQQPISNEDGTLWIVFNGEIFNYLELRPELESLGHRFATTSDTEVLLHLFEEFGPKCLDRLNGQFAFAVWNVRDQSLFLARDRLGVRPLFYTFQGGNLVFASEIKAILASRRVEAQIDPGVLGQVFTFWCPLAPRTIFKDIFEIPPGHYATAKAGVLRCKSYWELSFPEQTAVTASGQSARLVEEYQEQLADLLIDAARIRLRAEVPVGAYLSGGLDSSIIASIIRNFTSNELDTFSIAFDDPAFDESRWQTKMAQLLGTRHQVVHATWSDIGRMFPQVVWHAEVPLLRTAPVPMFMLSKLVRDSGYKVVLTGEGADEFLAGYDIFKEAKIRAFWSKQPDSSSRPLLLGNLYPDIANLSRTNSALRAAFFRQNLMTVDSPDYSHWLRWRNGARNQRFFSPDMQEHVERDQAEQFLKPLTQSFARWEPLARAQYLEIKIFLCQYLLSSQGDRMAMAHSVEGRFPFLDYRVVEFCNRLPSRFKLRGLTEKYLLKRIGRQWLPEEICRRRKRPYRAPIHRSFFNHDAPEYVRDLLSPAAISRTGVFSAPAVSQLVQKIDRGSPLSETDDMALAGMLSTQLLHRDFIESLNLPPPVGGHDKVKICFGRNLTPIAAN